MKSDFIKYVNGKWNFLNFEVEKQFEMKYLKYAILFLKICIFFMKVHACVIRVHTCTCMYKHELRKFGKYRRYRRENPLLNNSNQHQLLTFLLVIFLSIDGFCCGGLGGDSQS